MVFNILNDDDKKINQPNEITINLMNHQKTMIHKMLEIEETGIININEDIINNYLNIPKGILTLNTNVAILGDKVGAGKTIMTIGLISVKKKATYHKTIIDGSKYFSLNYENKLEHLNTNLIIVPHKILPQWKDSLIKFSSNIKLYTISVNKDINNIVHKVSNKHFNSNNEEITIEEEEIILEKVKTYDVVLITENMYKRFYSNCLKYKWNRIFIDEADSIKLPRDMNCYFNFLWLITGTPRGLFYGNSFLNKLFNKSISNRYNVINDNFVIKNNDTYIEESIKLPHPKRLKIKCISPRELLIIKDLIPPSILQMINAGNSEQAIKILNCNMDTNENIFQVITKNLKDSLINKNIELKAEQTKIYPESLKKEQDHKIKILENSIIKIQSKIDDVHKKIYELNNDFCPICLDEFTKPVILGCCNNCFCFDCLAVSLGSLHNNKCPYCRQLINKKDIHIFKEQTDDIPLEEKQEIKKSNNKELKEKMDVLIDLIENKPDGSFMIFANYLDTFNKIELKLKEKDITYNILKGHTSTVSKYIDEFKNKTVKVLMLNAQYFGAGMNLQMTTDLVMYHRFNSELEEQIIGRAQRLGRTTPLNVYYLLHDNEYNDIDDKFNFEDQGNIHYMDWLENSKKSTVECTIQNPEELILIKSNKNINIEIEDIIKEVEEEITDDLNLINFNIIN